MMKSTKTGFISLELNEVPAENAGVMQRGLLRGAQAALRSDVLNEEEREGLGFVMGLLIDMTLHESQYEQVLTKE
jgi:hypothetical protein